ncbi:hypothetical protein Sta7437_1904 [Stanieria cyanosphaera PCC 7437]|uniref:Uncharacterized protein n=1 Tax=Stanieria cyanosphaera (strain ATCC 29371 / PCC 7437) TaxID=111780 RepID=K9XS83_STAC7|nr:hypothetical protein [Stanieria cyanosphaera]AFZ35460.1 hypothetical protein Sta7437_1904 [Stanieria cyanosphaera PCC 7437]
MIATSEPANRPRLVSLAVLFGWTHANDRQFIFQNIPPRIIYSVDHGHFFPNPPDWKIKDHECNFTNAELKQVYDILINVTEEMIVEVVAVPPKEWGISLKERLGMIIYLTKRKKELQNHLESRLSIS